MFWAKGIAVVVIILSGFALAHQATAAQPAAAAGPAWYCQLDKMGGDGTGDGVGLPDYFRVTTLSYQITGAGASNPGTGAGAGKVKFSDLTFTKPLSKVSVAIFDDVATGRHLDATTCKFVRGFTKGNAGAFYEIDLKLVAISGDQVSNGAGDALPTETVNLSYASFTFKDLTTNTVSTTGS